MFNHGFRFPLQIVLMGVVRGIGFQKYGAIVNFIGFVCVATPTYAVLIFVARIGVYGKWIRSSVKLNFSMSCGLCIKCVIGQNFQLIWRGFSFSSRIETKEHVNDLCFRSVWFHFKKSFKAKKETSEY